MKIPCMSYCKHGGVCIKDATDKHNWHDSNYCQWSDEDSLDREEANKILEQKPMGKLLVDMETALLDSMGMLGEK